MRESNENENKGLSELFAELDEINKNAGMVRIAVVETCCDTGLI